MVSPLLIGSLSFLAMISLALLRVPFFVAVGAVAVAGLIYDVGLNSTIAIAGTLPFTILASYGVALIPIFYLLGDLVGESGLGRDAYNSAQKLTAGSHGGLATATMIGSVVFGAASGSSVANAALFTRLAYPEMSRYKYDKSLSTGVIAAAACIDIMIPPSITMVIYGLMTEESIGRLLMAGIFPGILTAGLFLVYIWLKCRLDPKAAGIRQETTVTPMEKIRSLNGLGGIGLIFLVVLGGIYTGLVTPTAAGALGTFIALILGLSLRRFTWNGMLKVAIDSSKATCSILVILIGGFLFARHLLLCGFIGELEQFIIASSIFPPLAVLGIICLLYIILGAIMDPMSMLVVTVPWIYPIVIGLGFNGIWFGIIFVMLTEIALLTPPIGANLYVVAAAAGPEVKVQDVIRGIVPFLWLSIAVLLILVAFPEISLFLPNTMFGK